MTTEIKNKAEQAFKNHLMYLSSGKIAEWVDLFTENGILEFPYATTGYPKKVQGKAALFEYMKNFPENFKVKFKNLYFHPTANPNLVIAEFESDGVAISTNNPYLQKYISVFTTDDEGKIQKYVDFWNPIIAMESLGVNINDKELSEQFLKN
jgi:uncharacterized protein